MANRPVHVSDAEAAADFAALLRRVGAGAEVVVEQGADPVALLSPVVPTPRKLSECIARLPKDSTATIDEDFAKDVAAAVECHREPLEPPGWVRSSIRAF